MPIWCFVSERLKPIFVIKSSNTQMAMSQKSRDREKWLSFPTKNKKISRCHIIPRDYPLILTFQQIPCNQKENTLKFKRKFEMPVFWDPPTFFRKDGDIAGDGTGGGGVPVRLEASPDRWKLAHRDWQRCQNLKFSMGNLPSSRMHQIDLLRDVLFQDLRESKKKQRPLSDISESLGYGLEYYVPVRYVYLCLSMFDSVRIQPKKVACPRLVLPLLRRVWPAVCVRDLLTKTFQISNSFQTKSEDLWK